MKTYKKLLLTAALGIFAVMAHATTIPLPYTTLPAGAPGTVGYTTNLSGGWTNNSIATNVLQYWTNSPSAAMVTVTNYITNSVITFADADVSRQSDFSLLSTIGVVNGTDVGSITNRNLTFARVSDNGFVDNVNTWQWNSKGFGATNWSTGTNFQNWIGTFKKIRLVQDQWQSTNGETMTNISLDVPQKFTIPTGSSNPAGH